MARNRKSQSAAGRFGPALKAFLLCLLIGGSGVGYVWQKDQINRLYRQIKSCEMRLSQLRVNNEKLRQQLDFMCSPKFLNKQIQDLKLGLGPPQQSQVLRLTEPPGEGAGLQKEQQFAAQPLIP